MQISDVRKELDMIAENFVFINKLPDFKELASTESAYAIICFTLGEISTMKNTPQNTISTLSKDWVKKINFVINNFYKSSCRLLNVVCYDDFTSLETMSNSEEKKGISLTDIIDSVFNDDSYPYIMDRFFCYKKKLPKINKRLLTTYFNNHMENKIGMVAEQVVDYNIENSKYRKEYKYNQYSNFTKELTNSIYIPFENDFNILKQTFDSFKDIILSLGILYEEDLIAPLPENYNILKGEEHSHNIVIRSFSHNKNFDELSLDLKLFDEILRSLSLTLTSINEEDNSPYTIRQLSTGTFEMFVTIYLPAASAIAAFLFLLIRECQQAKERKLSTKLKEKELKQSDMKITSQIINDAAKILSVDPNNEVYRKLIQQAGLHTLNYLQQNPHGCINDQEYYIQEETALTIEEAENINGDE